MCEFWTDEKKHKIMTIHKPAKTSLKSNECKQWVTAIPGSGTVSSELTAVLPLPEISIIFIVLKKLDESVPKTFYLISKNEALVDSIESTSCLRKALTLRHKGTNVCVFYIANASFQSPRKLIIFIVKNHVNRIEVSQIIMNLVFFTKICAQWSRKEPPQTWQQWILFL